MPLGRIENAGDDEVAKQRAAVGPGLVGPGGEVFHQQHLCHPHQPVGDGVGVELFAQFAAGLGRLDMRSQYVAERAARVSSIKSPV